MDDRKMNTLEAAAERHEAKASRLDTRGFHSMATTELQKAACYRSLILEEKTRRNRAAAAEE